MTAELKLRLTPCLERVDFNLTSQEVRDGRTERERETEGKRGKEGEREKKKDREGMVRRMLRFNQNSEPDLSQATCLHVKCPHYSGFLPTGANRIER